MPTRTLASFRSFESFARSPERRTSAAEAAEAAGGGGGAQAAFEIEVTQALQHLREEQEGRADGVMVAVQDPMASLMQSFLLESPPDAVPQGDAVERDPAGPVLEVKFDSHDIGGWLFSLFTWVRRLRPQPWLPPPAAPERIGNGKTARVALLSDWGTGLYGAPVCAESIATDTDGFDVLLHLGDVYYSGTEKEAQERFLDVWPDAQGARVAKPLSRTLNANHEMYTGGAGYFKKMLPAFGQASSCCAMETDRWLLIGLDSAYVDHDLTDDQAPWLEGLVAGAEAKGQRVVLFSHHQPFSLLDNQGPKLVRRIGHLLASRRIFAWYWGHEHRCVLYDAHPTWGLLGRCVGHSGYPAFRDKLDHLPLGPSGEWRIAPAESLVPGGLILHAPNPFIIGEEDRYGANGYLSLTFDDAHLHEVVHDPTGTVILSRQLV